jgi:predicted Zn-dependent protease
LLAEAKADSALAAARELQRVAPTAPDGYVAASAALVKLERTEDAHRELELGGRRSPGSWAVLVPLAQHALAGRHFSEAHRLAESITARTATEMADKRALVARILQASGRTAEALAEARGARALNPSDVALHVFLADLCESAGRFDEAITVLESAAAIPGVAPDQYSGRLMALRAARQAQLDSRTRLQLLEPRDR